MIKSFAFRIKSSISIDFITNEGKLNESKANISLLSLNYYIGTDTNTPTHIKWNRKLKFSKKKRRRRRIKWQERPQKAE